MLRKLYSFYLSSSYNKLNNLQILEAKLIAEQLFFVFIAVASLAAVAFAGLSVYLFFVTIIGKFNNKKWLSVFNPLLIMLVLIILSKILPANKVINGVFAWGQQSLVQRFLNPHILSACYFCQRKAEEGGNAVALLTDDNTAMAEIESTKCMRD